MYSCFSNSRSTCLDERNAFEHEGNGQYDVSNQVVRRFLGRDQLVHAMPDRDDGASGEEPKRGEHRPDVCLSTVSHGVPAVGPTVGSPVSNQQEDLIACIRPGMRGLGEHHADDVIAAATDLAMAMSKLARKAIRTVSRLFVDLLRPPLAHRCRGHVLTMTTLRPYPGPQKRLTLLAGCQVPPRQLTDSSVTLFGSHREPRIGSNKRGSFDEDCSRNRGRNTRAWCGHRSGEHSVRGHHTHAKSDEHAQ
jgi:hypothetical protein